MRQGHLLIGTERLKDGELKTWIVPATFSDNGLAMHADLLGANPKAYTITHVSSGLRLRGGMKKYQAEAMLAALASEDWTFHKDAVTVAHADRVREVYEHACRLRERRTRKAA